MKHSIVPAWLAVLLILSAVLIPASAAAPPARAIGIDTYIRQLADKSPRVQHDAVRALGESKDPRALDALIGAMKNKNEDIRSSVIDVLAEFDSPQAADAIITALQDPSETVRHSAMYRLTRMKGVADRLAGMLSDVNPAVRLSAAGVLVEMQDERGVEPLLTALKGTDPKAQRLAVPYVGGIWEPSMVEPLIGLLKDPDAVTRAAAAYALGNQRDVRAFDPLTALLLGDKSPEVRSSTLNAVVATGGPKSIRVLIRFMRAHGPYFEMPSEADRAFESPETIPYLAEGLKESDPMIRLRMLEFLQGIQDPRALEVVRTVLKDKDGSVRMQAKDIIDTEQMLSPAPAKAGPADVPKLLKQMKSQEDWERIPATGALCNIGGPKVVDGLIASLSDPRPFVWDVAGYILMRIGDPKSAGRVKALLPKGGLVTVAAARALQWMGDTKSLAQPLIKVLASPDPAVRSASIDILGDLRSREAVRPIIGLLKDPKVGRSAIDALGRIGGPEAAKALVPMVKQKDGRVLDDTASYDMIGPGRVVSALARIGDRSVIPDIIPLLKDPNPFVRGDAVWLLGELGDPQAADALLPLLSETDKPGAIYVSAAEALGKLGDKRAVPALIELMKNPGMRGSGAIEALGLLKDPRAVDALIGALPDARDFAAPALGQIGDQRAVQPLLALLNSPFPEDWRAAAKGLGLLQAKSASDRLFAIRHMCPEAILALGRLKDPRVLDELIGLLDDSDRTDYRSVVAILGDYGDARAVEPLSGVLKGGWPQAMRLAADALGEIKDQRAVGPLIEALKRADRTAAHGFMTSIDDDIWPPSDPTVTWMNVDVKDWEYRPQICSALKSITDQDFGQDTQRWASWWASQNKQEPK